MKTLSLLLVAGVLASAASAQDAPLQTEPLMNNNYDGAALDSTGGARDDSGWAGGKTDLAVVESGNGRALEAQTHGDTQIDLGHFDLEKGATYRLSLQVSSKGTQSMEIGVRKAGEPYTTFTKSIFQSFETPRVFSKFFTVTREGNPARVQIEMRATTTLLIDEVRVEKIVGGLPPQKPDGKPEDALLPGAPQTPDNLLLNSSFELGADGWFARGDAQFVELPQAFAGQRDVRLNTGGQLFSSFVPLSLRNDYQLVVRARAAGNADARLSLGFGDYVNFRGNTDGTGQQFTVKPGAWQRFAVKFRPKISEGQIAATKPFYAAVSQRGGTVEIDALEIRAIGGDAMGGTLAAPDAPYSPDAPIEYALSTDAPLGVATQGETVKVRVMSAGAMPTDFVNVSDESGASVATLPMRATGEVTLPKLAPGFYHLTTGTMAKTAQKRVEGETFLSVVPVMQNVAAADWHFGTHSKPNGDALQACLKLGWKWNRLHDVYGATKWVHVEPKEGEWKWDLDGAKRMKNAGFSLLGSLDILPAWLPKTEKNPGGGKVNQNATSTTENLRDEDFGRWREYCRRTAAAYRGLIDSWEVTNEPNLKGMTPAHYERVFREAVAGVRAGNPDARIVGLGGATPPQGSWLREVIALGGARGADALAFHNYGGTVWGASDGPAKLSAIVGTLESAVTAMGAPKIPLVDSESGGIFRTTYAKFPNPFGDASAREGAAMMPKAVAGVLASGLQRWYYYAAFDMNHPGEMAAFTFTDANHTVKMPFQTMAVAIAMLEGRALVSDSSRGDLVDLTFGGRGAGDSSRAHCMEQERHHRAQNAQRRPRPQFVGARNGRRGNYANRQRSGLLCEQLNQTHRFRGHKRTHPKPQLFCTHWARELKFGLGCAGFPSGLSVGKRRKLKHTRTLPASQRSNALISALRTPRESDCKRPTAKFRLTRARESCKIELLFAGYGAAW